MEQQSPENLRRIREEFGVRRKRQMMLSGSALVAIVPMSILGDRGPQDSPPTWALALCLTVILVVLIGSFKNWRCPGCNGYFGKKFFGLKHCGSCGVPLT